jgi:RNA polymerase sigma-70 factor (ECF subfamily)
LPRRNRNPQPSPIPQKFCASFRFAISFFYLNNPALLALPALVSNVPPDEPSDDELVERVATGSGEAFEMLVTRYQGLVRGTIHRMGWRNQDMEDLAQEVFLRVWKAAGRYRADGKFVTWLLTITRNVVFNEARSRSRVSLSSLDADAVSPEVAMLAQPEHGQPDAMASAADLQRAVDAALASLPEKQALALTLHRYQGLPHEEIAKILETTVASVKSLIFRARESLKQSLKSCLG